MTHVLLPRIAPPEPEPGAGCLRYRDAVVAQLTGYRPLLLDLTVPDGSPPETGWPVVVFVHSETSAARQGPLGRYLGARLLEAGFAMATVHFRHGREAGYPAQLHDVKAAVRWLRHHSRTLALDPVRLAAWGHGAGGYLAVLLAVTGGHPELEGEVGVSGPDSSVQAAVAWSPPSDFTRLPAPPPGSLHAVTGADPHTWLFGTSPTNDPALAAATNPLTHLTETAAPLLVTHGTADATVPLAHSESLVAAYWRAGADADFRWLPDTGHAYGHPVRSEMTTTGISFLRKHFG
ncbi:prolyl oligopeptidase family serine peptidase [Amycolatopsis jiangsuensis]|uniref:Acetyl esterase/lipase n=1 Tax=Amycolatopsis jiangsuensis TaxID=1181879 RepID=A0A840IPX8_9PSEU|nr:prolyl oligopeptidase family serine peptidase [Amycolatopsis jiangsuensis]MBB4683094.1 acetyl esterase/lipase [Amycolatopsis jiangsuensis]